MKNAKPQNKLLIHIDVDSPIALMEFYGVKDIKYTVAQLEGFYEKAWTRILSFFDKLGIKGTFFVVGSDLEKSEVIQRIVKKAHEEGHEIENHTYTHPFGLAKLPEEDRNFQIIKCNEIIESITGDRPVGFRAPGYNISSEVINFLEENKFEYDSSGFWSVMNPVIKSTHKVLYKKGLNNSDFGESTRRLKRVAYYPDRNNWLKSTEKRDIVELPLPRTSNFSLPFYNNFNLFAPNAFSKVVSKKIKRPTLVYLFHIIEFMHMTDDIPKELDVHPNLKVPLDVKVEKSETIIKNLLKNYEFVKTRDFISNFKKN